MIHFLIALLGFQWVLLSQAQTVSITSGQIRLFVETRNDRVKARDFEKQSVESKQGQLWRSYLPTVDIYGSQETFKLGSNRAKTQPTYGAELKVNIFNGGQDYLKENRNRIASNRMGYEKALTIAEQISEAHSVYWDILYLRDYLKIIDQAKATNGNNLRSASRRIQSGVATESDRIEFEMKEIELKQLQDAIDLKLLNQTAHLKLLLGFDENVKLEFTELLQHEHNWQGLIEHTEKDHDFLVKPYELVSEELRLEGQEIQRSYWPKLEAFAAYNQYNQREEDFRDSSDRSESVFGLRMTLHLFDGLNASRQGRALQYQASAAQLEAQYRKREIENHLHSEMAELKLLHNQVHDAEENILRSGKYYRLTQSEYSRGVKNSPDVLSASEKLVSMQVNRIDIIRRFQVSKSHLMAKIGK